MKKSLWMDLSQNFLRPSLEDRTHRLRHARSDRPDPWQADRKDQFPPRDRRQLGVWNQTSDSFLPVLKCTLFTKSAFLYTKTFTCKTILAGKRGFLWSIIEVLQSWNSTNKKIRKKLNLNFVLLISLLCIFKYLYLLQCNKCFYDS